jgi:small subunit ribosomal protein S16
MLAIRMQRTGRKGHAQFRVVVQDSHSAPTSGRFVALLGSYDPHAKTSTLVKDKAEYYLSNGAQPSDRVIRLFQAEGVKLPEWVQKGDDKKRAIRNPEKLRRNQPKEAAAPVKEAEAAEATSETTKEN